jgi:hypothetical protein
MVFTIFQKKTSNEVTPKYLLSHSNEYALRWAGIRHGCLSGAAKSGLKAGDVVQKINKQTTKAIADLENI